MLWIAVLLAAASLTAAQNSSAGGSSNLISISGISDDNGASYLQSQDTASAAPDNGSFVQRVGAGLQLGGQRYTYQGFNNYHILQDASEGARDRVTDVLDLAQRLGLTVMRMWAFSDGASEVAPVQPELGRLDPSHLEALDFVVSQAEERGIRLILTLSNYFPDYGGFQQYVEWVNQSNASTVEQFYTDPSLRAAYKDYATAIVLRRNTVTNRLYRDDPNILAWDLVNEPANYGDQSGDVLYDWLEEMSTYVKSIDANHLVYYGTPAFFGASSPDRLYLNPNYSGEYSPYGALPWDPACQGEDWARNIALPSIDLASLHFYPGNSLNFAADVEARVQGHLQVAADAGKPLVLDEFNAKRPIPRRNSFLQLIFGLIDTAESPVVGTNIWMLAPDSFPDYDQFEIYGSQAGIAQPLPPGPALTADWATELARRAVFRGFVAADACVRARFQDDGFVDGWQQTLSILSTNRTFS